LTVIVVPFFESVVRDHSKDHAVTVAACYSDTLTATGTPLCWTSLRSNLAIRWHPRFPSLLDLAEACDVPVDFGCRNGTCHSCESTCFAGEVEYTTAPLEEPPVGRVLLCCSTPRSELALDR
jgi:ferredoxin